VPELPDKLYFKIGEVAKIVGVKPHVLRYWESEFTTIRPGKTETKHRLYRKRDVETLIEIKRLLHGERYTIAGARRHLKAPRGRSGAGGRGVDKPVLGERTYREELRRLKRELEDLRGLLRS